MDKFHDAVGAIANDGALQLQVAHQGCLNAVGATAVEVAVGDGDVLAVLGIDDTALAIALVGMSQREVLEADIGAAVEAKDVGVARRNDDMTVATAAKREVVHIDEVELPPVELAAADDELLRLGTLVVVVVAPEAALLREECLVVEQVGKIERSAVGNAKGAVARC